MPSKYPTYTGTNGLPPHHYPPRKAEVFPEILNQKPFKAPSLVRQEANLQEAPNDSKEDPQRVQPEKA